MAKERKKPVLHKYLDAHPISKQQEEEEEGEGGGGDANVIAS